MPDLARRLFHFVGRPDVLGVIAVVSIVSFVASVVGVPLYLRRLPADYFSRREQFLYGLEGQPRRSLLWSVAKNALGGLLVLAGLAMLILPGQGLLTLVVGLMTLDFPGKKRLVRRVLAYPPVFRAVNALRTRSGAPPFRVSPESHDEKSDR